MQLVELTHEELAKIAGWESVASGFGRDSQCVQNYIHPILELLSSDSRLKVRVTSDGGMSNYFAFLVQNNSAATSSCTTSVHQIPCVVVQLSLSLPIGVYGNSTFSVGERFFAWSRLSPEQVSDPGSPSSWIAEVVIAAIHKASPYRLVNREITDQLLPADIKIYEYCLCDEPWDRLFHALFAETD